MNEPRHRHYCRQCRSKLSAPTENDHHGFCIRGCYDRFYRSRCVVCEEPFRRKTEGQRFGSGHATCKAEHRRFPHVYEWPKRSNSAQTARGSQNARTPLRSAHFTGLKTPPIGERPRASSLRDWSWGGDPEGGDHSLYNKDGLTIARVVLEDGRYRLRSPISIPPQSWPDLEAAKRGAESFALMALPLDKQTAARVLRDNSSPHPMGAPANLRHGGRASFVIREPQAPDDPGPIPDFLRRA